MTHLDCEGVHSRGRRGLMGGAGGPVGDTGRVARAPHCLEVARARLACPPTNSPHPDRPTGRPGPWSPLALAEPAESRRPEHVPSSTSTSTRQLTPRASPALRFRAEDGTSRTPRLHQDPPDGRPWNVRARYRPPVEELGTFSRRTGRSPRPGGTRTSARQLTPRASPALRLRADGGTSRTPRLQQDSPDGRPWNVRARSRPRSPARTPAVPGEARIQPVRVHLLGS